uniref:Uncharacterized protein n=1 Tax=Arundo donax TaxID=35708 RepID=A0A0A9BY77_ARUDO
MGPYHRQISKFSLSFW